MLEDAQGLKGSQVFAAGVGLERFGFSPTYRTGKGGIVWLQSYGNRHDRSERSIAAMGFPIVGDGFKANREEFSIALPESAGLSPADPFLQKAATHL